eukprot:TRINITY_DN4776_c0_g1_i4.p1 TRINITY_DN4776_c0_g1~~TRINITY_DN4776_c0_g1_i4.p1  ORF type:complete len:175 (+),score=29.74 TRINITY_DN4776_c0_g1_i4:83-607(+)
MNSNYAKAIERIKEKNGGSVLSELYYKTNEELRNMLYDLTGKLAPPRTSKTILVGRIERATQVKPKASKKKSRKPSSEDGEQDDDEDEEDELPEEKAPKKAKRGYLAVLTPAQIAEMKRIVKMSPESYTHEKLRSIWYSVGVTSQYPMRSSKATVGEKMKAFAERNLAYHDIPY